MHQACKKPCVVGLYLIVDINRMSSRIIREVDIWSFLWSLCYLFFVFLVCIQWSLKFPKGGNTRTYHESLGELALEITFCNEFLPISNMGFLAMETKCRY